MLTLQFLCSDYNAACAEYLWSFFCPNCDSLPGLRLPLLLIEATSAQSWQMTYVQAYDGICATVQDALGVNRYRDLGPAEAFQAMLSSWEPGVEPQHSQETSLRSHEWQWMIGCDIHSHFQTFALEIRTNKVQASEFQSAAVHTQGKEAI